MPVLLVTPRGERLGMDGGVRLPASAFSKLVGTLHTSHSRQLCHNDICADNMLAVKMEEVGLYLVLLSDWGSSMTCDEVAAAHQFSTHELYYNVGNMGAGEDLAALVRSVLVLTQGTCSAVETAAELDLQMQRQWRCWGDALEAALRRD
jgi:hypothetical protein